MNTKDNKKSTAESIKSELNAILQLNAKRKAALDKISKSISEKNQKAIKIKNLKMRKTILPLT